jgi:hypothetical protein
LQALDIPFEMPVIIRGKHGGTRQLIRGRRSYKTTYTLNSDKYGSVTFHVWIVCTYKNGKRQVHGREFFIYAVFLQSPQNGIIHYYFLANAEVFGLLNLQAHVKTFGLQVTPDSPITMSLAPTGNYVGWFTLVAPPVCKVKYGCKESYLFAEIAGFVYKID